MPKFFLDYFYFTYIYSFKLNTLTNPNLFMFTEYAESSIFIGLITTPTNKSSRFFFEKEFKNKKGGLFRRYKNELISKCNNFSEKRNEANLLMNYYEPKGYNLWGNMDLAIFSLVKDFEFGSYFFHPNHIFKGTHNDVDFNFDYRTLSGYVPITSLNNSELINKWQSIFQRDSNKYPLMSITKIKVNNSLLIGSGKEFLNLINKYISISADEIVTNGAKLDFLLLESFGCFEYSLVSFSNSIETITDFIVKLRECDVNKLINRVNGLESKAARVKKVDGNTNDILGKCILNDWANEINGDSISDIVGNSHFITYTSTIFGHDIDYYTDIDSFMQIKGKAINFVIDFDVKPGHLEVFLSKLKEHLNEDVEVIMPNDSEIVSVSTSGFKKHKNEKIDPPNLYELLNETVDEVEREGLYFDPAQDLYQNLNKFRTSITQTIRKNKVSHEGIVAKHHIHLTHKLRVWIFKDRDFKEIAQLLEQNRISNVYRMQIVKMFHSFNKSMLNPLLFPFFMETREYLQKVIMVLRGFINVNLSLNKKHQILSEFLQSFEHAYKNKTHQSNILNSNSITSNLNYNLSIQQIISGFDAVYKIISTGIWFGQKPCSIVYVSGFEGVDSDAYGLRVNYYHIHVVQLFLGVIVRESANFYINKASEERADARIILLSSFVLRNTDTYRVLANVREKYISKFKYTKFNRKEVFDYVHLILNENLFSLFFADQITYTYGFLCDEELLVYWYWSIFFQDPICYTEEGNADPEQFIVLMLRIIVLLLVNKKDDYIDKFKSNAPNQKLLEMWELYYDDVIRIAKWLTNLRECKKWFDASLEECRAMFGDMFIKRHTKEDSDKINEAIFDNNYDKIKKKAKEIHDRIIQELKQESSEFEENIKQGKIIGYNENSKNETSQAYILKIIYSYLKCSKELNGNEIIILDKQDIQNRTLVTNKMLFNPFGAFYTLSSVVRTQQFKLRCSILNSLIDFSIKNKKEYFKVCP